MMNAPKIETDSTKNHYNKAFHECGHAVAAWALGQRVREIRVDKCITEFRSDMPEAAAVVAIAGGIAEQLLCACGGGVLSDVDLKLYDSVAKREDMAKHVETAKQLILTHAAAISWLAFQVAARGKLTANDIEVIRGNPNAAFKRLWK